MSCNREDMNCLTCARFIVASTGLEAAWIGAAQAVNCVMKTSRFIKTIAATHSVAKRPAASRSDQFPKTLHREK